MGKTEWRLFICAGNSDLKHTKNQKKKQNNDIVHNGSGIDSNIAIIIRICVMEKTHNTIYFSVCHQCAL